MYMIFSAVFMAVIIIFEAGPVHLFFMADLRGSTLTFFHWCLIIGAFSMVILISGFTIFKSMQMGIKALSIYEYE